MGQTLGKLSALVAAAMGEQVDDTVDAGNVSSFRCARLQRKGDDYYVDWYGRFYEGLHRGTSFDVTDSDQATGTITFIPPTASNIDSTDKFYLSMDYEPEEIIRAVNMAIRMAEDDALEDFVDDSLVVVAETYEYAVPPGFSHIETVFMEGATANRYDPTTARVPDAHWKILPTGQARIWFDSSLASLTAGRQLRLIGQRRPPQLVFDTDVSEVSETYVVQQAKALLHQTRIRGAGADWEEHRTQMALAQTIADRERDRIRVAARGWPVGS